MERKLLRPFSVLDTYICPCKTASEGILHKQKSIQYLLLRILQYLYTLLKRLVTVINKTACYFCSVSLCERH